METKLVTLKEIASCPASRFDAEHYIPIHRTWECKHGNKLRTKGSLINAWLNRKITSEEFVLAMQHSEGLE